jgi:phage terminase large subunit
MKLDPAVVKKLRTWRKSPLAFVRDNFFAGEYSREPDGSKAGPDAWQVDVLEAAATARRGALKASKGVGKSTILAWIIWWFLATRLHPNIVATSISEDNLSDCLWKELAKWQKRSPWLQKMFTWSATKISCNEHPETWWCSARTWPKTADKNRQSDTLAGVHADAVLFVLDESGGIPDAVMATAEAGLANADREAGREAMIWQAGNPTQTEGPLYRACERERPLWFIYEISGAPNDPKRAPRVSKQWAQEQIDKYGVDNPWVLVNVFGKFPPSQSDKLIGLEECVEASRRTITGPEYLEEPKVLGIDVARFGDDRTVFAPRQGRALFQLAVFRNLSTMDVVGQAAMAIEKFKPDAVFIDVGGIGAGVVDRLKQLGHNVVGIDSGSGALLKETHNRRADMWWTLSQWVKGSAGGCIPNDSELIAELCAPKYSFTPANKILVESKKDMKKRGIPSPDKADAVGLTFAAPVVPKAMREAQHLRNNQSAARGYDPFERFERQRSGR